MWIAGMVLAASNFMVVLDISIANVSIQHIAGSLAVSPDESTWVITSYSVSEAICVPLTGWITARFGAVRSYMISLVGFTLCSMICGMSVTLPMLICARIGQGLCGGPVMPLTQTLLSRVFPPEKRGVAMGLWSMTTVVAPIAGPLIGGPISDNWSWHWIFFINAPIGVLIFAGAWFYMRDKETATVREPIDVVGLGLLVTWVGSLQIMLDLGRDRDWFSSSFIVFLAIVAAIFFVIFLIWELTDDHPIVNLRVFRHRGFSATVMALSLAYGCFFMTVVLTPLFLQQTLGYTATWSGYVTAWMGLLAVIASPIVGRFAQSIDPRPIASFGIAWMALSILARTDWTSGMDYWTPVVPHLMVGLGMAMFFAPMNLIIFASVDPKEIPSAAGLAAFTRTISAAFGTAIATTSWADIEQGDRADLTNVIGSSPDVLERLRMGVLSMQQARGMLSQLVDLEAATLALDHFFEIAAAVTLFAAFLVWLAPKPRKNQSAPAVGH